MSVKQRGSRWYIDVQELDPEGRMVRVRKVSRVQTKRGALGHESEVRAAIRAGEWVDETNPAEARPRTVAEFAVDFLKHQKATNRPSDHRLKQKVLDQHVLPALGHLRLDQVTAKIVDGYKASKLEGLKPNSVANHITTIKRMLNLAHEWGYLDRVPRIRQVKRPKTDFDYLGFEEAERFLEHAGEWRTFMLVAMRTGLRLGELRGLQWGDLDLERRTIRVARAFTKDGWGEPKSGKGRTVDLPWDVVEALAAEKPEKVSRKALVFQSPTGLPVDEKAAYEACCDASEAAELGRVVGPHKLRHTAASHHAMRGTPLAVIQQWLGHADITTTMRYAHLAPGTGAQFADRIAPQRSLRVVDKAGPKVAAQTRGTNGERRSKNAV